MREHEQTPDVNILALNPAASPLLRVIVYLPAWHRTPYVYMYLCIAEQTRVECR